MKRMFRLALVLYKSGGGLDGTAFFSGRKIRPKMGKLGGTLLLCLCFTPLAFMVLQISTGLYTAMAPGSQSILLYLANTVSAYLTVMFGIYYVAGALYFSDDNVYLLALPFSAWQIAGARFFNLLLYEYVVNAVVWIPYIVYGVMSGAGAAFYAYALVSFAALPVIPLALSAILVMLMMRLMPFFRNKDLFTIVATSLLMVGMVYFSLTMSTTMRVMQQGNAIALDTNSGILGAARFLFPGLAFSAKALASAGTLASLGDLALFLLCNAAAVGAFLLLARAFYLRAVTSAASSSGHRAAKVRQAAPQSIFAACLKREWRLLVRSPVALLNCVAVNFMWPVIMGISLFSGQMANGQNSASALLRGIPWNAGDAVTLTLCICFAAGMFLGTSNLISTTAISREGHENLAVLITLPVDFLNLAMAKIAMGIMMGMCAVAMMLLFAIAFAGMPLWLAGAGLLVVLGAVCAANTVGLLVDLRRPRIHWDNEQQAIKQNLNGVFVMFGSLAVGTVLAVVAHWLANGPWMAFIVLLSAGWVLCFLLYRLLRRVVGPWLMRIEI